MTRPDFLPYGRQVIDEQDIAAVTAVLRSDYLTTGPKVADFELALAQRLNVEHAVVCANGTAALHLAYLAEGIGPGDKVIVPAITFLATANAVRLCGADVVFADVDPDTALIKPDHVEQLMQQGAKAVVPVHYAGQCVDMAALAALGQRYDVAVIEDACHALGSFYGEGFITGDCHYSSSTCFSFHPVKTIAMGEGGAITTNDAGKAQYMRDLRQHGMVRDPARFTNGNAGPWYYEMNTLGFNYRANDLQCALGESQLKKLDTFATKRRALVRRYEQKLCAFKPHIRFLSRVAYCDPCWHLAVVLIDFDRLGKNRNDVMEELRARGIGTQIHYYPVSEQPFYTSLYGHIDLPGAKRFFNQTLSLPLFPSMTEEDVDHICTTVTDVLGVNQT